MARQLKMGTITGEEFAWLRRAIPAVTKEGVMATYRISQHSWYKLRDGKPVKQSVIERLRERYAALAHHREGGGVRACRPPATESSIDPIQVARRHGGNGRRQEPVVLR